MELQFYEEKTISVDIPWVDINEYTYTDGIRYTSWEFDEYITKRFCVDGWEVRSIEITGEGDYAIVITLKKPI